MLKFPFNYNCNNTLYRRNNFGQPYVWSCVVAGDHRLDINYGIVGKTISYESVITSRNPYAECVSRITEKRKEGYKYLDELKDNTTLPVEGELLNYLNLYLPVNRTTADGSLLAMLAKTYDNKNNRLFKKCPCYDGQWKINGLRCFVGAKYNDNDMFKPISLTFQSREGTYWNSLYNLEEYLLEVLPAELLNKMVEENYILDGELYLPGYSVNEINHFVKSPTCKENKLIQYWCYDFAIDDMPQWRRDNIRYRILNNYITNFHTKEEHLNNTQRLITLPTIDVTDNTTAIFYRDKFIDLGFEGLILRNPKKEYQYGKRNLSMIKFKRGTDGKFKIIDIYPEGTKRQDIPLFLCKNDINDATFECHVGGNQEYQKTILKNKDKYIGKTMFVCYGERSGVNQVPFHITQTYIL